jgi:hypothetical protein
VEPGPEPEVQREPVSIRVGLKPALASQSDVSFAEQPTSITAIDRAGEALLPATASPHSPAISGGNRQDS